MVVVGAVWFGIEFVRHPTQKKIHLVLYQMSLWLATVMSLWASQGVPYETLPAPRIQPATHAFGIWWVLYALLGALAWRGTLPPPALRWLCASLWCTVLWTGAARVRAWHLAAFCLAAAAACAWVAAGWCGETTLARASVGLYAGWLSVATALALAISVPAWDSPVLFAAAAAVVVGLCGAVRTPWPMVSVAWAALA